MISESKTDVMSSFSTFKSHGLSPCFLVPTSTGMGKSIMDATETVRNYLKENLIHNFAEQPKGQENKKIIHTKFIFDDTLIETKTSLYRPQSKDGDPRIWIYDLAKFAEPYDLLAVLHKGEQLIVINCSRTNLDKKLSTPTSPIYNTLLKYKNNSQSAAEELLSKCRAIAQEGFITTKRPGDTGIGYTYETLLGIKANSSSAPDYKGIEIKTARKKRNRSNLFSKTPDWDLSKLKSGAEIVEKRGSIGKHGPLKTIFNTISATKINSDMMSLKIDNDEICQIFHNKQLEEIDVKWSLSKFIQRVCEKHRETFWVSADVTGENGNLDEAFHYNKITHTGAVDTNAIPILISGGKITLDYLLWEKTSDWKVHIPNKTGHDYLWKIKPKDRHLLFKFVNDYDL